MIIVFHDTSPYGASFFFFMIIDYLNLSRGSANDRSVILSIVKLAAETRLFCFHTTDFLVQSGMSIKRETRNCYSTTVYVYCAIYTRYCPNILMRNEEFYFGRYKSVLGTKKFRCTSKF